MPSVRQGVVHTIRYFEKASGESKFNLAKDLDHYLQSQVVEMEKGRKKVGSRVKRITLLVAMVVGLLCTGGKLALADYVLYPLMLPSLNDTAITGVLESSTLQALVDLVCTAVGILATVGVTLIVYRHQTLSLEKMLVERATQLLQGYRGAVDVSMDLVSGPTYLLTRWLSTAYMEIHKVIYSGTSFVPPRKPSAYIGRNMLDSGGRPSLSNLK